MLIIMIYLFINPLHDVLFLVSEGDDQSVQEQEEKITSYEEAFAKIKDATGVSDIQVRVSLFPLSLLLLHL